MNKKTMMGIAFILLIGLWALAFALLNRPQSNDGQALPTLVAFPDLPTIEAVILPSEEALVIATALPTEALVLEDESAEDVLLLELEEESLIPATEELTDDSSQQEVVLQFAPTASQAEREAYLASIGGTIANEIPALNTVVVRVPNQGVMIASPVVQGSEPNFTIRAAYEFSLPTSDPYFTEQWGLQVVGATLAWNNLPENAALTVAVIDSGVCLNHPDLAGRVLAGWDFVENDAIPQDDFGHGCAVAGIIAANIANNTGIAGLAPHVSIMPLRVLDGNGIGNYSDTAEAIVYATHNGARIINLSIGGASASSILQNAIQYATSRGVLVIAAAGNTGSESILYPAAYPAVVAVGSVDANLQRSSFSSRSSSIDLYAPGAGIVAPQIDGNYAIFSGTSFAAPHVTGIAALEIGLGRNLVVNGGIVAVQAIEGQNPAPTEIVVQPTATITVNATTAPITRPTNPDDLVRTRPEPSDNWLVILENGANPLDVAYSTGFVYAHDVTALANTYVFRREGTAQSLQAASLAANSLSISPQVIRYQQEFILPVARRVPTDPLFGNQWHLQNTGQSGGTIGIDANVVPVWNAGITGNGIVIAIVDDGMQINHPDLGNYSAIGSYDFRDNDSNPSPLFGDCDIANYDCHGTSVAGIAAAEDDNVCGVGAAYDATISGIRLIGGDIYDFTIANALSHMTQYNQIYNNSWGIDSLDSYLLEGATIPAMLNNVTNGRGGLGSIYVFSAGNSGGAGMDINRDPLSGRRFGISVAALNHFGQRSSYSTLGSSLFVTAPSSGSGVGTTTSDLTGLGNGYSTSSDCTNTFGGTSSAAPLVAGVVALMLDENPNLTWRDVQHILVETSKTIDVTNIDVYSDWQTNAAGYDYSHAYGFGLVDAEAAVTTATDWLTVPSLTSVSATLQAVNQAIPTDGSWISRNINIDSDIIVEHVEVRFSATHGYVGDIMVQLFSPEGTSSNLLYPSASVMDEDYTSQLLNSRVPWGENARGTWTIFVRDVYNDTIDGNPEWDGTWDSWQITVYGYQLTAPNQFSANNVMTTQFDLSWTNASPNVSYTIIEQSPNGVDSWVSLGNIADSTTQITGLNCETTYYFRGRAYLSHANLLSPYSQVFSQTTNPCNDSFATASVIISVPTQATVADTFYATSELGDPVPSCGTNVTKTFWYSFTPAQTGTYNLTTIGSNYDVVLWLGVDSGGFNQLACDKDSAPGKQAFLSMALNSGTTYYIMLGGHNNTAGTAVLNITMQAAPTETPMPTLSPVPTGTQTPVTNTIGLYNPNNHNWQFRDANTTGESDVVFSFGGNSTGWQPVVGDWNGDGIDGIGLYKDGTWLLRDNADAGVYDYLVYYGAQESGWQPVIGDWNGDTVDDLGLFKNGQWRLRNSPTTGTPDNSFTFNPFNGAGRAIAGDWNGDGLDTVGLYNTGEWRLTDTNSNGTSANTFNYGMNDVSWLPIVGDWNADGIDTIGLYNPVGLWRLRNSNSAGYVDVSFNFVGAGIPVANYRGGMGGLMILASMPSSPDIIPTATASPVASPTELPTATDLPSETPIPTEATVEVTEEAVALPPEATEQP